MHIKPTEMKIASHKKLASHHVVKFRDEVWRDTIAKRTTWKQRGNVLSSAKGLQLIAVTTPPIINHLS